MEKDRISDLRDHVLEQILSFLTLKEAVRTSILSKRWRRMNICSMLSNLNFSHWFVVNLFTQRRSKSIRKKNRRLIKVLNKILLGRNGVEKLFLEFPNNIFTGVAESSLQLKLGRWMKCVAKPGLTELSLVMCAVEDYFEFPLAAFASIQSLQKLTLKGFRLTSLSYGDIVRFSSLRTLCLWNALLDDDVMQKLLQATPLLENLEVLNCPGVKVLQVRQQVNMVLVCDNSLKKVMVTAPKLEALQLAPQIETIVVETCLPLLRKIIYEAHWCPKFNPLVEFRGLKMPIGAWFTEFLPLCPLLEHLTIDTCPTLHNINVSIALHALKTLRLSRLDNAVNVTVNAPNLETFYINAKKNLPFVELNASNKLEVEMELSLGRQRGDPPDYRLVNFLSHFNHARSVKLCFGRGVDFFIPKEKRKDFPSLLYGTKYLQISTDVWSPLSEYVDFMLWLSPQATNLKIKDDWHAPRDKIVSEMVLECVYEEKENFCTSSSCTCNESLALKCWRHCLKEVEIQEFMGDEAHKESLKTWLWQEVADLTITEKQGTRQSATLLAASATDEESDDALLDDCGSEWDDDGDDCGSESDEDMGYSLMDGDDESDSDMCNCYLMDGEDCRHVMECAAAPSPYDTPLMQKLISETNAQENGTKDSSA